MLYHCFKTNDQTRPRRPAPRPAQLRTPATTCVRTTRVAGSVQQARWGTAASTAPAAVTVQAFLSTSRYAGRCSDAALRRRRSGSARRSVPQHPRRRTRRTRRRRGDALSAPHQTRGPVHCFPSEKKLLSDDGVHCRLVHVLVDVLLRVHDDARVAGRLVVQGGLGKVLVVLLHPHAHVQVVV